MRSHHAATGPCGHLLSAPDAGQEYDHGAFPKTLNKLRARRDLVRSLDITRLLWVEKVQPAISAGHLSSQFVHVASVRALARLFNGENHGIDQSSDR